MGKKIYKLNNDGTFIYDEDNNPIIDDEIAFVALNIGIL